MNNWIATEGSPFVIVEQQYAHQWNGQEDYNAICSVTDYLGKIYIDNHVLLVMGDEPMATRIVNKDGAILIIRWKYAPDYLVGLLFVSIVFFIYGFYTCFSKIP